MKEERKLSKVKISLMRDPMFALWQGVMMVGKTSVDDNVPTACTNGRDEIYGRKFVQDLSEKELAFVVLHESMHKAYRHLSTWTKLHAENPLLTNMACDYVINLELKDLDPETIKAMRDIWDKFIKEQEERNKPLWGLILPCSCCNCNRPFNVK